jgi:membrane-associated phospholipid phosphatase
MTAPPIIDIIGYYGPVILFALTFYYLIKRPPYLMMFTIGSIASTLLNRVLKSTWREPRPRGQITFIDHNNLTGAEQYGLPSGHAQASFFALAFLFFSNGPQAVLYVMTLLCVITLVSEMEIPPPYHKTTRSRFSHRNALCLCPCISYRVLSL